MVDSGDYVNESDLVREGIKRMIEASKHDSVRVALSRNNRSEMDALIEQGLYRDDADLMDHALDAEIARHKGGGEC